MKDETQHAFDVKTNPIYGRIENSDLEQAAQYALLEAGKWDDAVAVLQVYKNRFDSQICVMTSFSIELYLKTLLMMKGVNVTTDLKKHHLNELFYALDTTVQEEIKDAMALSDTVLYTMEGDYIKLDTFEKVLEFVSNDFVQLRYEYEKFMNGEPIFILQDFLITFRDIIRSHARTQVYPA